MGTASLALRAPLWPTYAAPTPGVFQLPSASITGAGVVEWYASPVTAPRVLEISLAITIAANSAIALGRPDKTAYRPTTVLFQNHDPQDYATSVKGAVEWVIPPWSFNNLNVNIVPWIRRFISQSAVGSGVVWVFPRGLKIPPNGSLFLAYLGSSNQVWETNCVIEE